MGNKIALGYLILSGVIGLVQANIGFARRSPDEIERGLWLAIFWPFVLLTWPGRRVRRRRILRERAERERQRVLTSTLDELVKGDK